MRKQISAFALFAFLLPVTSANADQATSKPKWDSESNSTILYVSDMQVCAEIFDSPEYRQVGEEVDKQYFRLLEADNLAWKDPVLYNRKIAAYKHAGWYGLKNDESDRTEERLKRCNTNMKFARGFIERLGSTIAKLEKSRTVRTSANSRQKNGAAPESVDCPHSADHYAARFKKSGKMADIACFKKAGMRELNDQ
jgi:hypothetical protein